MFFITVQYFQFVRGYSPLLAGAAMLPNALAMIIWAPRSAAIVTRFGARPTIAGGLALHATGFAGLSLLGQHTPYVVAGVALFCIGTGSGLAMAPTTAMIMAAVSINRAGMGSAVNDTAREVGGAAGIAVLGSILATRYRSGLDGLAEHLPGPVEDAVRRGIGQALTVADTLSGTAGSALRSSARDAFVDAMAITLRVGSATAVVAAVSVLWLLRAEPRRSSRDLAHTSSEMA
jgi:hypothetical protein